MNHAAPDGGPAGAESGLPAAVAAGPPPARLAGQPVGRRLRVRGCDLPEGIQLRLLELGLTAGVECRVVRYAPLGDPMEVEVRGYCLSVRAAEARGVLVDPTD